MPTITKIIEVTTDTKGAYYRKDFFNPPGPFGMTVKGLKAELLSPADTTITGTIDFSEADSNPHNHPHDFKISTGEQISLGEWKLGAGKNILVASGQTSPVQSNTVVRFEVRGTI